MTHDLHKNAPSAGETSANTHGIVFHIASRRRYIPYSWLLYAELNRDATEIQFHFTHSTVTVTGKGLEPLHDWACQMILAVVEESPTTTSTSLNPIVQRIETTEVAAS